jgi:hypothetical protein
MLCLLLVGRRTKGKKKKPERINKTEAVRDFFPGQELDTPCWLCWVGSSHLLGAITG